IRRTTVLSAAKSKNPKATTQSFHLSLNEKKKKGKQTRQQHTYCTSFVFISLLSPPSTRKLYHRTFACSKPHIRLQVTNLSSSAVAHSASSRCDTPVLLGESAHNSLSSCFDRSRH
ncbi:hypothetical protein HN873_072618, partial [Arachis hypogaea]